MQCTNCPSVTETKQTLSETCSTSSSACTVSNKEEHTLHHLFKSLIRDVPGRTTGWYALSLHCSDCFLPHLVLHIATLFIVNLWNWFAKWTNKRNVRASRWMFTLSATTFSAWPDSTALSGHNHSHPATSPLLQFTLHDIIPLCSLSAQKANLFAGCFEKRPFSWDLYKKA